MIELIQIITILPVLAKMKSLQNEPTPTPAYRNREPCDSHLMKYQEIRTVPQFTANKRKKTMMRIPCFLNEGTALLETYLEA